MGDNQRSGSHREKIEWWLLGTAGWQRWELLLNEYRVSILQEEKSSRDGW